jgi:proline dehydrogenase
MHASARPQPHPAFDTFVPLADAECAGAEPAFSARPGDLSAPFALSDRRQSTALSQALCHAQRLARWRIGATLAFTPPSGASHRAVADAYLQALDESATLTPRAQLLVKPAALGHDRGLLHEVLGHADALAVPVLFEHGALETTDEVMACLMDLQETHHAHLGLSLLASRERSLDDARLALAWGLRVRLEHDWPAFDRSGAAYTAGRISRQSVGARFLALAKLLAAESAVNGRSAQVSVITHEPVLADQALGLLLSGGVRCSIELRQEQPKQGLLYVARQRGVAVRSHIGWGGGVREAAGRARDPRSRWWSALQDGLDTLLPAT